MLVVYPKELVSGKEQGFFFFANESSNNHLGEGLSITVIKFVDDFKMGGVTTTYREGKQKACND